MALQFIEQNCDPQIPPPYKFTDVSIRSFRLDADLGKLRTLCNQLLNIGSMEDREFQYWEPILPFVDLEVLGYPRMESTTPPHDGHGYTSQRELYFRIFVAKFVGDNPIPDELAVFMPYIFVDNTWSIITGRDVIGYPKLRGWFDPLSLEVSDFPLSVGAMVFKKYGAGNISTFEEIVNIQKPQLVLPAPPISWPWGDLLTSLPEWIIEWIKNPARLLEVQNKLLTQMQLDTFPLIQFKQIRDAEHSNQACYQALIHAQFEVTAVRDLQLLPPTMISIPRYDSLTIAEDLGLSGERVPSLLQYTITCDMTLGDVRDLVVLK